jgi:membrane protein YqaA with SNARE-associated domain
MENSSLPVQDSEKESLDKESLDRDSLDKESLEREIPENGSLGIYGTCYYFCLAVYSKVSYLITHHYTEIICTFLTYFVLYYLFPSYIYGVMYWMILGVLSSIGLGTGLHTFILYLAPHIIATTVDNSTESYWQIYKRVVGAAICWGMGTAIGELPPYILSKTSHETEVNAPKTGVTTHKEGLLNIFKHHKLVKWIEKWGFIAILLFASIPNPLFDLAGIICGSLGLSFWTFFLATLTGKTFIKAQIQTWFIILGSHATTLEYFNVKDWIRIKEDKKGSIIYYASSLWQLMVICLLVYFIISVIRNTAKNYYIERLTAKRKK